MRNLLFVVPSLKIRLRSCYFGHFLSPLSHVSPLFTFITFIISHTAHSYDLDFSLLTLVFSLLRFHALRNFYLATPSFCHLSFRFSFVASLYTSFIRLYAMVPRHRVIFIRWLTQTSNHDFQPMIDEPFHAPFATGA